MKTKLIIALFILLSITTFSQIKVACIGNSITYGAFIEDRETMAYPQQLDQTLGDDWKVINYGSNGATMLKKGDSPYWELPLFQEAKIFQPDVVIIMLGTNDSKPQNWIDFGHNFKQDYKDMIYTFQNLDSKPIIFLGIPVPVFSDRWGITKKTVEGEITDIVKEIAKEQQLDVIDFYSLLKEKRNLFPDKIHPNAEGAEMMADEAAHVLLSKLKDKKN